MLENPINFVEVAGQLTQIDAIRYTPAGVALLSAQLAHQSVQLEAGLKRVIEQNFKCRFAGKLADQVSRLSLGSHIKVRGFLASAKRGSMSLIVHVQELEFGDL